jgi:hypothetical protein
MIELFDKLYQIIAMKRSWEVFQKVTCDQFEGNLTLMRAKVFILEQWVQAAEAGYYGAKYSSDDITRTRSRIAEIRSGIIGGSSENAHYN